MRVNHVNAHQKGLFTVYLTKELMKNPCPCKRCCGKKVSERVYQIHRKKMFTEFLAKSKHLFKKGVGDYDSRDHPMVGTND